MLFVAETFKYIVALLQIYEVDIIFNIVEVGINYDIYFSVEHPLGVKLNYPRHCKKSIFFNWGK